MELKTSKMFNSASKIAEIIINTNTDDRGLLLLEVSNILRLNAQGFTSRLLREAAETYGYPELDHEADS